MRVKVIASHPINDQDDIASLVGKEFEVQGPIDEEDGRASVNSPEWGGIIQLNKNEYEVIP